MSKTQLAIITILETGGKPDQGLPKPPGKPDQGLPGQPPRPDQGLPPAGSGGRPTHPIYLPPTVWPPSTPPGPDNTLPDSELPPTIPVHLPVFPPEVDNTLPGAQPKPDQGLPRPDQKFELKYSPIYGWILVPVGGSGSAGARPDQGLPPSAQPKK
jgi:hypothetical protein